MDSASVNVLTAQSDRMPTEPLGYGPNSQMHMSFRVWGNDPAYLEDDKPWKLLAAFRFLQECLDYIAYCQDRGNDVVFQSPADCRLIKATDLRAVYKEPAHAST